MSNIDMSEAVRMLAADKGITVDALLQVLVDALATAYKRRPGAADEVTVSIDPHTLDIAFTAYDIDEDGNWINERDDTPRKEELGRIAAQTFRQVMSQRIREAERDRKFEEYANREGDIVTGIIQQTDSRYTLLDLGKVEALLPQAEQVPYEKPEPGARLKAYIVEVRRTAKGPQIVVSRTHPGLIKRLFELEVPEIADGIVEIKACAREPGHRTKIAVWSNDHNVDPVGACVGARGGRVRMVVNELRGEKIDIVPFSEDLPDFIAKALSPARVTEVRLSEDLSQADVIVPDFQLSLAIGKEGQNARLAARLTGVRVDIKSETQASDEAAGIYPVDDDTDYAEGEWVANADTGVMEWHAADGTVVSAEEWEAGTDGATDDAAAQDAPKEGSPGDAATDDAGTADDAVAAKDAVVEEAPAEASDETEGNT
jgi:N utilization substance protein A